MGRRLKHKANCAAMSVPFLACMAAAAAFYHLPPRVLPSIQVVEGGRVGSIRANANGTADLGVMQINTIWIGPLAAVSRLPPDSVAQRLINDPCFNIAAGAAILGTYLLESRGNLMVAIGHYHSHTAPLSSDYAAKVVDAASKLFVAGRPVMPQTARQPNEPGSATRNGTVPHVASSLSD